MPGEAKGLPTEAKGLPAEAKGLPAEAKGLPGEAKGLPGEARALPGEAKGLPTETKASRQSRIPRLARRSENAQDAVQQVHPVDILGRHQLDLGDQAVAQGYPERAQSLPGLHWR